MEAEAIWDQAVAGGRLHELGGECGLGAEFAGEGEDGAGGAYGQAAEDAGAWGVRRDLHQFLLAVEDEEVDAGLPCLAYGGGLLDGVCRS